MRRFTVTLLTCLLLTPVGVAHAGDKPKPLKAACMPVIFYSQTYVLPDGNSIDVMRWKPNRRRLMRCRH